MAYKDGGTFTTYCDKPYDKHSYKIVLKNGQSIPVGCYEDAKMHWYQFRTHASHIEVIDAKGTGF